MFFRNKGPTPEQLEKEKLILESHNTLFNSVAELRTEIDSLIGAVQERDEIIVRQNMVIEEQNIIIKEQAVVIEDQKEEIEKRDNKIQHLTNALHDTHTNDIIDKDTKLYTKYYYDNYLVKMLSQHHYCLTMYLSDKENAKDLLMASHIALEFGRKYSDTCVLWDKKTICIFVHLIGDDHTQEKVMERIKKQFGNSITIKISFRKWESKESFRP